MKGNSSMCTVVDSSETSSVRTIISPHAENNCVGKIIGLHIVVFTSNTDSPTKN